MYADNEREPLGEDQLGLVVEVFRMLSDATRVQLLWALVGGEQSVTALSAATTKPATSVSQHLAKLRMARLVTTRRAGTTIYYSIASERIRRLVLDAVHNAEHAGPGLPEHHRVEGAGGDVAALESLRRPGAP